MALVWMTRGTEWRREGDRVLCVGSLAGNGLVWGCLSPGGGEEPPAGRHTQPPLFWFYSNVVNVEFHSPQIRSSSLAALEQDAACLMKFERTPVKL